jgi:hypothetical protein
MLNYFRLKQQQETRPDSTTLANETNSEPTAEQTDISMNTTNEAESFVGKKAKEPVVPVPKLPKLYHKPQSKFKKQVFFNAVTVYVSIFFI